MQALVQLERHPTLEHCSSNTLVPVLTQGPSLYLIALVPLTRPQPALRREKPSYNPCTLFICLQLANKRETSTVRQG